MELDRLQMDCHELAVEKGFWGEGMDRNIPEALCLIHSEVSEALECIRENPVPEALFYRESDGKPEGFAFELADIIIRVLDLAEGTGIGPLAGYITEKLEFNRSRPMKHGKEF